MTYAKPFSDWKSLFTRCFPQHIMDKGRPEGELRLHHQGLGDRPRACPVASGPYLMDKAGIDAGKQIMTLTRNPKWWGEPSKLDRIIVQVHRQRPDRVGLRAS